MEKRLIVLTFCFILLAGMTSLSGCAFGEGDLMRTYPSDYECVQLWMDPAKGVVIDQGTMEVISWKDLSDKKITFYVQSGAPYTMYYDKYETMYFDTSNGYFYSGQGLDIGNEAVIFVVADLTSGSIISSYSGGIPFSIEVTSPDIFIYPGSSYVQLASAASYSGYLYLYEFHVKYPSADVIINGGHTIYGSGTLNSFNLKEGINIGIDSYYTSYLNAYIAELIICDNTGGDDETTGIRKYLLKKYNITPW